jgi:hypothetical protein
MLNMDMQQVNKKMRHGSLELTGTLSTYVAANYPEMLQQCQSHVAHAV